MASSVPPLPVSFQRKPSSRISTGKTNKQAVDVGPPPNATQVRLEKPEAGENGDPGPTRQSEKSLPKLSTGKSFGRKSRGRSTTKTGSSIRDIKDQIAGELKDKFDLHLLVDKLFERIYRCNTRSREAFRSLDPEGKGAIPINEFFTALGLKFNMQFSERERRLLTQHCDNDGSGTIDYQEFLDKFDQPCNVYERAVAPPTHFKSAPKRQKKAGEEESTTPKASPVPVDKKLVQRIREKLQLRKVAFNRIFDHIDQNADGFLSAMELKIGLKEMGFDLTEEELDGLVKFVDGSKEGGGRDGRGEEDTVMTYNEFRNAFEEEDYAKDYDPIGKSRRREITHYAFHGFPGMVDEKERPDSAADENEHEGDDEEASPSRGSEGGRQGASRGNESVRERASEEGRGVTASPISSPGSKTHSSRRSHTAPSMDAAERWTQDFLRERAARMAPRQALYPGHRTGYIDRYPGANSACHDTKDNIQSDPKSAWFSSDKERLQTTSRLTQTMRNQRLVADPWQPSQLFILGGDGVQTKQALVNDMTETQKRWREGKQSMIREHLVDQDVSKTFRHAKEVRRDRGRLGGLQRARLNHMLYATGLSYDTPDSFGNGPRTSMSLEANQRPRTNLFQSP